MNFGGDVKNATWTSGPVAGPNIYTEAYANPGDVAMGAAEFATKNENESLGFNVEWKVSNRLKLEFDAHRSSAESGADSPYGSSAVLGGAQFTRTGNTIDFTKDFPVMTITGGDVDPAKMLVTGSAFRNSYMLSKVEQVQVKGAFKIDDDSGLNFGLGTTKVDNRSAFANMQRDSWGGVGSPSDYADSSWRKDTLRQYFSKINGSDNPALYNQIVLGDFAALRAQAIAVIGGGTSDFSVVRVGPGRRLRADRRDDILANHGVHIAGTDFDRQIELAALLPLVGFGAHGPGGQGAPGAEHYLPRPRHLALDQHLLSPTPRRRVARHG